MTSRSGWRWEAQIGGWEASGGDVGSKSSTTQAGVLSLIESIKLPSACSRGAPVPRLLYDRPRASFEYEIVGADVADVISWAESESRGRRYVLYVCVDVEGLGLLPLAGRDPNTGS